MLQLTAADQALLAGAAGEATAIAMRILTGAAQMLGADQLIPIASAHIDGCLYHGDSGTHFAERLVALGGKVEVPASLNVGGLDLVHAGRVQWPAHETAMAKRLMMAYQALGCQSSWTCAPYQAGHRPAAGSDVAWGESNAVVFCNSVLGARTNRYGDFLDICAALTARAPRYGLHLPDHRIASILIDASGLPLHLLKEDALYPVLGAWLGQEVGGSDIAAFEGLPRLSEDQLKALGAAAAATGAVGLFHVIGTTPEAPDRATVFAGSSPHKTISLTATMLETARNRLSTASRAEELKVAAVAIGSPHLSVEEIRALHYLLAGRHCQLPFYACTGRHVLTAPGVNKIAADLAAANVHIVTDTCVVVAPILPVAGGTLLTNSGKFAHYAPSTIGYAVVFGTLRECVETAVAGRWMRDEGAWQ